MSTTTAWSDKKDKKEVRDKRKEVRARRKEAKDKAKAEEVDDMEE